MTHYDIYIPEYNSADIRYEAERMGVTHMREIATGSNGSAKATLFALPVEGGEIRVLDTNGDPVWEENDPEAFAEDLEFYGIAQ